jgi:GTP pyrophosphokinase
MEDAALSLMLPDTFMRLDQEVSRMKAGWRTWAEKNRERIGQRLGKEAIPCVAIMHRVKHTAGVWTKMERKGLALDEIYDLFAFRIVVPTEVDCYAALGVVHELYEPDVSRFKDYIADPKANGYRSLHTCVRAADGPPFEIQIRSVAMEQQAEQGDAAHWVYKQEGRAPDGATPASTLLGGIWRAVVRTRSAD